MSDEPNFVGSGENHSLPNPNVITIYEEISSQAPLRVLKGGNATSSFQSFPQATRFSAQFRAGTATQTGTSISGGAA